MSGTREFSTITHNDAWSKHIKKLSQGRDNSQFSHSTAVPNQSHQGLSKKPKWGK